MDLFDVPMPPVLSVLKIRERLLPLPDGLVAEVLKRR
jgi:hypothetical protein